MDLPVVELEASAPARRLPPWLRVNLPAGNLQRAFNHTSHTIEGNQLHTVCEEARCPNIHDCWSRGTATFMIAGDTCTRGCRFCSVKTLREPPPPDIEEPEHLASAVERMGLEHVVITVVNRDDLADGGAAHYRRCVDAVHRRTPDVTIELLSSDLGGSQEALASLLQNAPLAVFAHNVECVPRLDGLVRDGRASFDLSLQVLESAKHLRPDILTKSSLMVGLGETDQEVSEVLSHVRQAGVDLLTIGQYLSPGRPGERFRPVDRYVPPQRFDLWKDEAFALGYLAVAAGPLVRSSYRAGQLLSEARQKQETTGHGRQFPASRRST